MDELPRPGTATPYLFPFTGQISRQGIDRRTTRGELGRMEAPLQDPAVWWAFIDAA
jgi:hypothetical protein